MKVRDLALAGIVLVLLGWLLGLAYRAGTIDGPARVIDGDTVALGGRRIRLLGIDAPELDQTCVRGGTTYRCGQEARDALRALTHGRDLGCLLDGTDKFGRALAVCRVAGKDVGEAMVSMGWAIASGRYAATEASAERAGRGLWAGTFDRPGEWRRTHPARRADHGAP